MEPRFHSNLHHWSRSRNEDKVPILLTGGINHDTISC